MFGLPRSAYLLKIQEELQEKLYKDVKSDWHLKVTETAGFVPLEVRFQKLFESGVRVQLRAQEFDSVDMRKLYLDDEFRVEPDDELEDIEVKLQKRQAFLKDLKLKMTENKTAGDEGKTSGSNSESKEPEVGKRSAPSETE